MTGDAIYKFLLLRRDALQALVVLVEHARGCVLDLLQQLVPYKLNERVAFFVRVSNLLYVVGRHILKLNEYICSRLQVACDYIPQNKGLGGYYLVPNMVL